MKERSCCGCIWADECIGTRRCPHYSVAWDILGLLDDDRRLGQYIDAGFENFLSDHKDDIFFDSCD